MYIYVSRMWRRWKKHQAAPIYIHIYIYIYIYIYNIYISLSFLDQVAPVPPNTYMPARNAAAE